MKTIDDIIDQQHAMQRMVIGTLPNPIIPSVIAIILYLTIVLTHAQTPTPAPSATLIWINLAKVGMIVPKSNGCYSVEYDDNYFSLVKGNPLDAAVISTKGGTWVKMELVPEQ